MTSSQNSICQCPSCQAGHDHPNRELHLLMNLIFARLNEQQRRWFAALEAQRRGHGGTRQASQILGLDEKTIRRGRRELLDALVNCPAGRIRGPGAGRSRARGSSHSSTLPGNSSRKRDQRAGSNY
jgi:hypothetical protein